MLNFSICQFLSVNSRKAGKKIISVLIMIISTISITHAQHVEGTVVELNSEGKEMPLEGANVFFPGTTMAAITDANGSFHLHGPGNATSLVITYVGYKPDTITSLNESIKVVLKKNIQLNDVTITGKKGDSYISTMNPVKTEVLTSNELRKNACCNLAESFESNPTVDVSFTDAVTGAKKIQLLGLSGIYVQTMTDVLPTVRGLAINNGFNWIPGSWVESIQLNKGTGSVANGFESITGQINVELKKPETAEKIFVNAYGNNEGRGELNLQYAHRFNKKVSTMLFASGSGMQKTHDANGDGFVDMPEFKQAQVFNRWKYSLGKHFEGMFGAKFIYDERNGGQIGKHFHNDTLPPYLTNLKVLREEAFYKTSYNPTKEYQSLGIQLSGINHQQDGNFGLNNYSGSEQSLYANLIWQSILGNTKHKYRAGLSYLFDDSHEQLVSTSDNDTLLSGYTINIPGAFAEYTYDDLKNFSAVIGIRADDDEQHIEFTPRLHIRWNWTKNTTFRASGGRGFRYSNVFAENPAIMATSREIVFSKEMTHEIAWNFGANLTQNFYLNEREANFSLDVYRTQFENQIVVDYDFSPQQVLIGNLSGQSYANSIQASFNFFVAREFEVRLSYKYNNAQQTLHGVLMQKALTPLHRALFNTSYEPNIHWKFDATVQWVGEQRIPNTFSNPEEFQFSETSPSYFRVLAQVNYKWKKWEWYVGSENLTNFIQKQSIISAENPYSDYFDSSLVWGPLTGRMFYLGIRFAVK